MPLYEYECESGHRFDEFHSMDNRNKVSCPACNSPVHIKISLYSFRTATPFTVVSPEHGVIHHQPDGGNIRPWQDVPAEFRQGG